MPVSALHRSGRPLAAALLLAASLTVAGCVAEPAGASSSAPAATAATPSTTSSIRADRCETGRLEVSVDSSLSGQQTIEPSIVLKNAGARACTVRGVPTVAFVRTAAGGRIGPVGYRETAQAQPEITLQPGAAAETPLIVDFPDKDARPCGQVDAAGFSMALPGDRRPVFVAYPYPACRQKRLIAVFPVQPR